MSNTEVISLLEETEPLIHLKLDIKICGLEGTKEQYKRELKRLSNEAQGVHISSIQKLLDKISKLI